VNGGTTSEARQVGGIRIEPCVPLEWPIHDSNPQDISANQAEPTTMPEDEEPRKPYEYNFRTRAEDQSGQGTVTGTTYETLISMRDSLLLMTGGCDVV